MFTKSDGNPLPVRETTMHKTDNLAWDMITAGSCELNYPAEFAVTFKDYLAVVRVFGTTMAIAPLLAWIIMPWIGEFLTHWLWGMAAGIIGGLLAIYEVAKHLKNNGEKDLPWNLSRLFRCLLGPAFLWLVFVLTSKLHEPAHAFLYFLAVATPMLFVLVDSIATHAVYWFTASLTISHDTQTIWRNDWRGRFLDAPSLIPDDSQNPISPTSCLMQAIHARQNYYLGGFWFYGAILIPCLFLVVFVPDLRREAIGFLCLASILLGLTLAVWVRLGGNLRVCLDIGSIFNHWLHYGNQETPPWMFHSPCGTRFNRLALTAATLGLLHISICSLACYPVVFWIAGETDHSLTMTSLVMTFSFIEWCQLAGLICLTFLLSTAALYFGTTLLVGPILYSYSHTLEKEEETQE